MSQPDAGPEARVRWILWGALLVSQLVYLGIAASGVARVRETPLDVPLLPLALAGAAVGTAGVAHFFWRRASGAGRALHEAGPGPADAQTSYVLAWVCDEAVALYGLVLAFLGFGAGTWLAFGAAGLALLWLHRPASRPA